MSSFIAGMLVYVMVLTWFPWDRLPPGLEGGENLATILGMVIITRLWSLCSSGSTRVAGSGRHGSHCRNLALRSPLIWLSSTPLIRLFAYPRTKTQVPLNLSIADR